MSDSRYTIRPLLLAVFFVIGSASVFGQINDTYVISAAANTPGSLNTRWVTEFNVFNPQPHALRVTVVFLPSGGAVGNEVTFLVESNENAYADNVLAELFSASGTGALLVATFAEDNPSLPPKDIIARSFLVTTNTFNNASAGTYGQSIPGVWAGLLDYEDDGISAVANGVSNDFNANGFRTNVGAVNLGRTSVHLKVSVHDAAGRTLANRLDFVVPPLGHIQDRLPIAVRSGSIEFFVDDPSLDAVVFPYASTIDNLSGDPVYFSPILLASPSLLYGKTAAKHTNVPGVTPGKRIDSEIARRVASSAIDLGEVHLVQGTLRRSRE